MKIIYEKPTDAVEFDIDRYHKSLNRYGKVDKSAIKNALKGLRYDPMHCSVLVELGVRLLPNNESAETYYNDHVVGGLGFERLRRITGYLVGSLERWNDGKRAEERDRVKHGVYSQENKDRIESEKSEMVADRQNEYRKGV